MSSTDPIADMLSRIRNAIAVSKNDVSLPHSKLKETIARLLVENGFLQSVSVRQGQMGKTLTITINSSDQNAAINQITRLSTPGRRRFAGADRIPVVKRGRGLVIISTSQGVMTGQQARSKRLGGELICKVY